MIKSIVKTDNLLQEGRNFERSIAAWLGTWIFLLFNNCLRGSLDDNVISEMGGWVEWLRKIAENSYGLLKVPLNFSQRPFPFTGVLNLRKIRCLLV